MTNPRITLPRAPETFRFNRYLDFCQTRQGRKLDSNQIYEVHHIVPKKIGGKDTKDNLVTLTVREHYIAHKLLVSAFPKEIAFQRALWCMSHTRKRVKLTSRQFEELKLKCKDGLATNLGKTFSETHKAKIGAAHKNKVVSASTKALLSTKAFNRAPMSNETRRKCGVAALKSAGFKGKAHSEETKNKMSESLKGLRWFHKYEGDKVVRVKATVCPDGFKFGKGPTKKS